LYANSAIADCCGQATGFHARPKPQKGCDNDLERGEQRAGVARQTDKGRVSYFSQRGRLSGLHRYFPDVKLAAAPPECIHDVIFVAHRNAAGTDDDSFPWGQRLKPEGQRSGLG
jgi:hypothetical protein